jgi:hypothetical protein
MQSDFLAALSLLLDWVGISMGSGRELQFAMFLICALQGLYIYLLNWSCLVEEAKFAMRWIGIRSFALEFLERE